MPMMLRTTPTATTIMDHQRGIDNRMTYTSIQTTETTLRLTMKILLELTFQAMSLVHPIYDTSFETEPLLIGMDLKDRLDPLMDPLEQESDLVPSD